MSPNIAAVKVGGFRSGLHNLEARIGSPDALDRAKATDSTPRMLWIGVDLDNEKFVKTRGKTPKDVLSTTDGIKNIVTSLTTQVGLTVLVFPESDI